MSIGYFQERIPPSDSDRFREILKCHDEKIFDKYKNMLSSWLKFIK